MNEIVLFGDVNVDVLMAIHRFPESGGDAMAKQITLRPGGSVANTAIVLSKLGQPVKLIGRVGDDLWAKTATQPLIEMGIDISALTTDFDHSTGLIFIPVTAEGERTMFSYRGANIHKHPQEIDKVLFSQAEILHISSYNLLESPQRESTYKALEIATDLNLPISMDIGVEPALKIKGDLEQLLPVISLIVLGMDEARQFVRAKAPQVVAEELLEKGVSCVGLKLGRQGCLIASSEGVYRIPGLDVETVDTTGAGDAFCAGLLYGMREGLGLGASGLLANILGALTTTVWGCGSALPGRDKVSEYLSSQWRFLDKSDLAGFRDEVIRSLRSGYDQ